MTERVRDGRFTSLGAASGVVAGLVGITPAANAVSPLGALAIGALCGVACCLAIGLKFRLGFDDSLDVAAVHLVGGVIGTLLVGLLATDKAPAGVKGLLYGGGFGQLGRQAIGCLAVAAYCTILTLVIAKVLDRLVGLRIPAEAETAGIDTHEHAETGYDFLPAGEFGGDFLTHQS